MNLADDECSLRGFLASLQEASPHDVVRVRRPINPVQEPTALLRRLEMDGRLPVVFFENVIGSEIPLVMNVHATRERLALALGVRPEELNREYQRRLERPIQPTSARQCSVKEIVLTDERADLGILPIITPSANTPAPYISGGIVVTRDPAGGHRNLSYNRLMVRDHNRLAFHPAPGLHLHAIWKNATARGQALPVAIIVGYHPAFALGTLAKVPFGIDEYTCASSILQRPVGLVPCETIPLEVPADAEIVIEGKVLLNVTEPEGPYDEFTGYAMPAEPKPVIEISAITHRRQPIFQDVFGGAAEHLLMGSVPKAASLEARLRGMHPEVRAVHLPLSGCGRLHAVVSVASNQPPTQIRKLMLGIFALDHFLKHVWIVDEDVDVYSDRQVLWAMSTCFQGDRDVLTLERMPGTDLDPSAKPGGGIGAKIGFDCTRKRLDFPARNHIDAAIVRKMNPNDWT